LCHNSPQARGRLLAPNAQRCDVRYDAAIGRVDCRLRELTSTKLRCVGLLQWMREGECIDLHASFKNFPHGWIRLKVATVQHLRARERRYQTDIGNGGRIAAARPSCSRII